MELISFRTVIQSSQGQRKGLGLILDPALGLGPVSASHPFLGEVWGMCSDFH